MEVSGNKTNTILLSIWVVIGILVLIVGIINALSLTTISNAIKNDSADFKTTWDIISENWDIVVAVLIMLFMFSTIAFQTVTLWYKSNLLWAVLIFLTAAIISSILIVVKRLVLDKKKSNTPGTS